jgi:hypothetical protein
MKGSTRRARRGRVTAVAYFNANAWTARDALVPLLDAEAEAHQTLRMPHYTRIF